MSDRPTLNIVVYHYRLSVFDPTICRYGIACLGLSEDLGLHSDDLAADCIIMGWLVLACLKIQYYIPMSQPSTV